MNFTKSAVAALPQSENPNNLKRLSAISASLGLLACLTGIAVLVGWLFDIEALTSVLPSQVTMKANTAMGILLCGLSIVGLAFAFNMQFVRYGIMVAMLFFISIVLLTLLEYLLQIDIGIDQLVFVDWENRINPGRMSPTTAFCFLNITTAIFFTAQFRIQYLRRPLVMALSITAFIISSLVLISYIPNLLFSTNFFGYANMGIHTAILFVLLTAALLLLMIGEHEFHWVLSRVTTVGCILGLITLLATSSAYYRFIDRLRHSDDKIIHTQLVNQELNNIFTTIVIPEGEKKTDNLNNIIFLENAINYKSRLNQSLDNADQFISTAHSQQLLNQLRMAISGQNNFSGNTKDPITANSLNMEELFSLLSQLKAEEDRLFHRYVMKQDMNFNQALFLSPLGIFLGISLFSIGLFILNASVEQRKKAIVSQKKLAEIVESSNDGIIGNDLHGVITSWNKGAERIFGYSAQEMIGRSILTLIPDDRIQEEIEIIERLKQGQTVEHFETLRMRKDGKPMNVSITISPVKNTENEIVGASKIVRDFTEHKQLELQFRQSQKMGAIGQLTGGIAHDFNNLLGIILGNLDLLERNLEGDEESLKRVNNALKAATRGADLTKRLLAFSRMQQLMPVPTRLEESVNNIVEMASRILGSNITMHTELDTTIPPVLIDPAELESALLNLIVNARDAMPDGGKLVISTKSLELDQHHLSVQANEIKPGAYACIAVSDNGEGISPETLAHVFEPFFTTKARGKGTGMGLSMVYGFVKQSGGIARIYSEVGHGTTISLYLPFAKEVTPIVANHTEIQRTALSGKALVVDDEIDLLEIAAIYLKGMGFDVLHAIDGQSAIDIFEKTPDIKLLVTDIVMPGNMNGFDLAKKIRALKEDIIVVYTSGFPAGTVPNKDSTLIDALLINKPYNRETFVNTIYKAFENPSTSAVIPKDKNHG